MMNQRLRELVEQAITEVDVVYEDNPLNEELAKMYIPDCFAEKFAELIVRECIDTINGVPNGYGDYRNQIEDAMREACVDSVKQKFGVE